MRLLFAIAVATTLSGCWYDVRTGEFVEPGELEDVPLTSLDPCHDEEQRRVACVLDGDTFDADDCGADFGERFRLLGIDAPEISHEDAPAECFGDTARQELTRLIEGNDVRVTYDQDCEGVFGRTLGYIWVDPEVAGVDPEDIDEGDEEALLDPDRGLLVNEWMLAQGYARLFPVEQFGPVALQARLDAAEALARSRGLGLWGACN